MTKRQRRPVLALSTMFVGLCGPFVSATASAQDRERAEPQTQGIEDIVVTARKLGTAEAAQDVPIAITAFGGDQLEELKVQNLSSLTVAVPNVQFESVGVKGVANFSIRGLGINSSIPSIEPTVGTFVDGVYMGTNYGVVLDTFDLERIEVLRGPQGLLFGRNVTGGAVLLRTRRPGDRWSARAQMSVETGPQVAAGASIEAPIAGEAIRAKLAGYYRYDDGWFTNDRDGSSFGKERTWFVRPTIVVQAGALEQTFIYERGRTRGDGSPTSNPAYYSGFHLALDTVGYGNIDWQSATSETNLKVGPGDGVVTNIFGYRRANQDSLIDVDGQPAQRFDLSNALRQDQYSNELRYSGRFGANARLTAGLYYFRQKFLYVERRVLLGGAVDRSFGGDMDQHSWGAFGQIDIDIAPELTLTGGVRYSFEKKTANVAPSAPGSFSPCVFATLTCAFSFHDSASWSAWTPKLGFSWDPAPHVLVYGSWSKGVRSGGYNVRSTSATIAPGPFDQEDQTSYELGLKSDLFGRTLRLNVAGFYNQLEDMQREIILPDPPPLGAGVVQLIRNTADARIYGAEVELTFQPVPAFQITANAGYSHGEYTAVRADLNGDGALNGADLALDLPRLARWSFNIGATYVADLADGGALRAHADFGHRDRVAFNDANTTFLSPINMLGADLGWTAPDEQISISVYGRNLLNRVTEQQLTPLPASVGGGAIRPLNEGRVLGVQLGIRF